MKADKQHDKVQDSAQSSTYAEFFTGIIDESELAATSIIAKKICRIADIKETQLFSINLKSRLEQHTHFYKRNLELIEDSNDENTASYRFIDMGIKNPTQLNSYICQEKKNGKWVNTKVGLLDTLMAELSANAAKINSHNELEESAATTNREIKGNTENNSVENESNTSVETGEEQGTDQEMQTKLNQEKKETVSSKTISSSDEEHRNKNIENQGEEENESSEVIEEAQVTDKETSKESESSTTVEVKETVEEKKEEVRTDKEQEVQKSINNTAHEEEPRQIIEPVSEVKVNTDHKKGTDKMEEIGSENDQVIDVELFKQESWDLNNKGKEILLKYLQIICNIGISRQREKILANDKKDTYLANTGLLNRLGKDVYVIFNSSTNDYITNIEAVISKAQLIKKGFTRDAATTILDAITPWKNEEDLKFNIKTIEEFELPESTGLETLLTKLNRTCKQNNIDIADDFNLDMLYDKIESSINRALSIYRRDSSYITPVSSKQSKNGVAYAIPFDKTGLYMIAIINEDEFAEIKDIMDSSRVFTFAKVINPFLEKLA